MFRVREGVSAWLRLSLQRWLILPVVTVTLALGLLGAALGSYLIGQALSRYMNDTVRSAGNVAASAFSQNAHEMRLATLQALWLAETERLLARAPATSDDPTPLRPFVNSQSQTLALISGDDGSVLNMATGGKSPEASVQRPAWLNEPAVGSMLARALNTASDRGKVTSSVLGVQEAAALYAAGAVPSDRARGLLVARLPLAAALQRAAAAPDDGVVLYDAAGRPVFGIFPAGGPAFGTIPILDSRAARSVFRMQVAGQPYVVAAQKVSDGEQDLGYLAVWRPAAPTQAFVRRWQILFASFVLVGAVATAVASTRQAARLFQPVTGMVDAARAVAAGNFDRRVPETSIGELGVLAGALNAMAGQVERQTGTLRDQARDSNYLFQAGAELGRTLDMEDSLQTAAEAIYGLGQVSYVIVLTGRGELGPYTCVATRGLEPDVASRVMGCEYAVPLWGVMARALVLRQPVVIDDIVAQNRPLPGEFNWDTSHGSMLLFPVASGNNPFACLIIGSDRAGAFGQGQRGELAFALARIASHSIQNAHLYQEALRSQEQLVTVQVISRLVASSGRIETVLDVVMREATEIMGESQAWVYLRSNGPGTSTLYSRPRSAANEWSPVHQDAVAWVMQAGQPIFYNPSLPLDRSPILVHSGPAMCVPLEADNEAFGALVVVGSRPNHAFAEDDMIVLRTLANAAAAALHNRQLARRFESGYLELARTWSRLTDMRLWGQPGHGERVATNAVLLASSLNLPADLLPLLRVAGHLHDIAASTSAEDLLGVDVAEADCHATMAAEWLGQGGLDSRIATLVRYHHWARPDRAISDTDLGQAAGTLALVHAVDTWLLGDDTRPPRRPAEVRQALVSGAGGNFIPSVLDKCLELLDGDQLVVP